MLALALPFAYYRISNAMNAAQLTAVAETPKRATQRGTAHPRAGSPPPVRLDPESGRAWCGERLLDLTPKAFTALRHFVDHPDRLVTKDELFTVVWGDTVVSEAALTSCIRDLRRALADGSHAPRYVETVHRRGFRFIGPVGRERVEASP